jgi:hypothetical protein
MQFRDGCASMDRYTLGFKISLIWLALLVLGMGAFLLSTIGSS